MINFVNLHNHSSFSLLDALPSPKELLSRAKELGQGALALTDHGTFAGAWDALKASKELGVKLIIGAEFYFQDAASNHENKFRHVILLAKNQIGYSNLLTLNFKGFDNKYLFGNKVYSVIDWDLLQKYSEGVICLTSCSNGIVGQLLVQNKLDEAEKAIIKLKEIFKDDLGLEVQANNLKRNPNLHHDGLDQNFVNRQIVKLAKKYNIKVVPTSNTHYLKKEDADIHDTLLAIGSHTNIYSDFRLKYSVPDFYLKTGEEVKDFFDRYYDESFTLEMCENTVYFSNKCEFPDWIDPKFTNSSGKELPSFPVKDEIDYEEFLIWKEAHEKIKDLDEDNAYLRYKCQQAIIEKNKNNKEYQDRVAEELEVLEYHGFSSYMLIVADYINWARENNISVGEGRGSVGGSLVAYLLGIHHADPIEYNLIFARFHNKEKKSYPDIDSDFATSGRDKVKAYLIKKYGDEYVAHVSNVNTITPKVYARDIARAHEFGSKEEYVQIGNNIADSISKEIHSISDAFENAPLFSEYAEKYPQLNRYSSISGKYRAWSTHAGGIVISKRSLVGLVPVRRDKENSLVLEYDKERAEENGLVKMDILGLSTLDVVDKTLDIIKSVKKVDIKMPDDFNDSKTYDLISKGDTFCVFQLGTSGGTMDLCRQIKPRSVDDISHINSLARPSAKDMRSDFIKTKDGKREFSLIHSSLNRAFKGTFGFGLYEESLMYLAQDVAGWSLHEADRLRKLTKEKGKNPKKVAEWRASFIEGAVKNNIQEEIAKKIWDETVSSFSGYGFNKSHSVMYSMLSYKTAWLKANFPIEFLLANLVAEVKSNALDADKKISKIKKEIRDKKINILPPDINKSLLNYSLIDENNLLTGLDALKFVTDDAVEDIVNKRPFNSFFEFMVKVSTSKVRSNTIQALAASGCLDSFNIPRKLIFLYCSDYRKKLGSWLKKHDPSKDQFNYPWPEEKEWDKSELFALENFYLGEGFICQPKDAYKNFFKINNKNDNYSTVREVKKKNNKDQIRLFKAIVRDCFEFKIKKEGKNHGKIMLKADIEDVYGDTCSLTVFPDSYQKIQDVLKLKKNKFKFEDGVGISFSGSVNVYEDETGLVLNDVYDIIPPPQLPLDLKAKKVSIKSINKSVQPSLNEVSKDELFEEIESSLIDEGFVEPDEN